jgi:hypothetical protein
MITSVPTTSPNQPLFVFPSPSGKITFKMFIDALGLNSDTYSFHGLRRGGATASYKAGVDYLNIQRHGTWRSNAFWEYISTDAVSGSKVPATLSHYMQTNCPSQ